MRIFYPPSLIALLVVILTACTEQDQSARPDGFDDQPVLVEEVSYGHEQTFVEAVGTSRALQSVDLRPAVAGEVVAVNFAPNERVGKGQTLIQLKDDDERLAVELARVELRETRDTLARYRSSSEAGGITESELDAARNAVDRARIDLERAQVALQDHKLVAPFRGRIGLTDIDPGAWVTPDTVIASLDNRTELLVNFDLPELLFGTLMPGTEIELSSWSNHNQTFKAEVVAVASRIDESQRNFRLRARLDNREDRLRPGMSFRISARLPGNRYPQVPELALEWGGDGGYVWMLDQGKARRVPVTLVERRQGRVLVDGDLPEGAYVVTEGTQRVREGAQIRPLNLEAETTAREQEQSHEPGR